MTLPGSLKVGLFYVVINDIYLIYVIIKNYLPIILKNKKGKFFNIDICSIYILLI